MRTTPLLLALLLCASLAHAVVIYHDIDPVAARTDTSFSVEWTTDVAAISNIGYGTTTPPDRQTQNNTFTRTHRMTIDNLQPDTDYHFMILAVAEGGQTKIDDNGGKYYKASTKPQADRVPPRLANITFDSSEMSTTARWTTNEPATSLLWYGDREPVTPLENGDLSTTHELDIQTTPNTLYKAIVGGCDKDGNCANSSITGFYAGSGQFPLNISVPPFAKQGRIDIVGATIPGAEVRVIINNASVRATMTGGDGSFGFNAVDFVGKEATVVIRVRDPSGNTQEQSFNVVSDSSPPLLILDAGIPAYVGDTNMLISGSVNEPVTLTYGTEASGVAPARVSNLRVTRVTANTVELAWDPIPDITHYAVYRDGQRIALTTQTVFIDSVSAASTYQYKVSAVGASCAEGQYSSSLSVQTNPEGLKLNVSVPEAPLVCGPERQSMQASGKFSFSIQLMEGENKVYIEAADRAGNKVRFSNVTTVDTVPPQFLETNLGTLSPSYTPLISVKGKLNKQGTVLIYVNDEKPVAVLTGKNGGFSKEITLSRDVKLKTAKKPLGVAGETGEAWDNKIKLEAIDLAGRKATAGPTAVQYALCGYGNAFTISLGKPLPDVLTPRLIMQGVQQAGFSFNASYHGGRPDFARPPIITVRTAALSAKEEKNYDHDWVHIDPIVNPRKPTEGYVQLSFIPKTPEKSVGNKSISTLEESISAHRKGECKVPGFGCVKMMLEIEIKAQEKVLKTISDPRVQNAKEDFILRDISQKNCVDVELMIDYSIPLSKNIPKKFLETSVKVLDSAIDAIDTVLDPLITVGTYTTYGCFAMNGVLFGMFFSERMSCEFANLQEGGLLAGIESVIGKGNSIRQIAEIGMCEVVFDPSRATKVPVVTGTTGAAQPAQDRSGAYAACKKCQDAISRRVGLENKMRVVCDRVACPSAPTVQTYIKDFQKQPLRPVKTGPGVTLVGSTVRNNVQGLLYTGSSCAFKGEGGQSFSIGYSSIDTDTRKFTVSVTDKKPVFQRYDATNKMPAGVAGPPSPYVQPTPEEARALSQLYDASAVKPTGDFSFSFGTKGIKDVYIDFLKHRKDKSLSEADRIADVSKTVGGTTVNCAGLHPANPECCGYEYNKEWASACGIPGIDTFDEIKESACLAAQNANQIGNFEREASTAAQSNVQCKSLFNAVAGFCEPGSGQPVGDTLPTGIRYVQAELDKLAAPDLNEVYIRLEPVGAENNEWSVVRGYVRKRVFQQSLDAAKTDRVAQEKAKAEALRKNKQTDAPGQYYLNAQLDFVPDLDPASDLSVWFKEGELVEGKPVRIESGQIPPGFSAALCTNAADNARCQRERAKIVYQDVRSRMGVVDKTYIVRPDRDGILRSTQCVCLPAVTSYLSFWKNVMGAVRNCFQTVKLTGDASSGICQAVLSQYVCDMLYDVLSCFTQKYSTPGSGTTMSGRGGIGDVMGALTAAGGDMQRSINTRYGDTALWRSMFVERKLIHSVCAFAFTGTWDLDLSGMYKQTVEDIPLKTQGFLYPAERRFISYNPVTRPSGLPTFTYHFGVGLAAGDDLRYQLELKCSNSLRCEPRDGFDSGKCDCFGRKDQYLLVGTPELGNGQLKKNDILNVEVFYTLQGIDGGSGVRYDTAVLSWESMNPSSGEVIRDKKEVPIHVIGSSPPNFCRFDPLALSFRCDIGIGDYTGGRLLSAEPRYPAAQTSFVVGQPLSFNTVVKLIYPDNLREQSGCMSGTCPYTKWLAYEIKNQQGQIIVSKPTKDVISGTRELKFEETGDVERTITLRDIKESDFSFASQGTSDVQPATQADFDFTQPASKNPLLKAHVLVITPDKNPDGTAKGTYKWELFEADTLIKSPAYRERTGTGQFGWYDKGTAVSGCTGAIAQAGTISTKQGTCALDITFSITAGKTITQPAEYFLMRTATSGAPGTVCEQYKTAPANWTATFMLYDSTAVSGGNVYELNDAQPTVDPSSGEVQTKEVMFSVYCSENVPVTAGGLRECPKGADEPAKKLTAQCFCGTPKEAADAGDTLRADPQAKVLNCGPNAPAAPGGDYCIYKDITKTSDGRICSAIPGPVVPKATSTPTTTTLQPGPALPPTVVDASWDYPVLSRVNDQWKTEVNTKDVTLSGEELAKVTLYPGKYTFEFEYAGLTDENKAAVSIDGKRIADATIVKDELTLGKLSAQYLLRVPLDDVGKKHVLTLTVLRPDGATIGTTTMNYEVTPPIVLRKKSADCCVETEQLLRSKVSPQNLLDIVTKTDITNSNEVVLAEKTWANFDSTINKEEFTRLYVEYVKMVAS